MHSATTRLDLEQELARVSSRIPGRTLRHASWAAPGPETLPTGIPEIDALTGGFPRGQITQVTGTVSSGRTSLLLSVLAEISSREEVAVLVDPRQAFDPASAAASGVELRRLLWIRSAPPARPMDPVLRVTDLLLEGGGFGLIGVDLGDLPGHEIRRIPQSVGFRLQRAAEHTPTVLVFLSREPVLATPAALTLRMTLRNDKTGETDKTTNRAATRWSGRLLVEASPEARILRSRSDPSACRQTRSFRLVSPACIESGTHPEGVS